MQGVYGVALVKASYFIEKHKIDLGSVSRLL